MVTTNIHFWVHSVLPHFLQVTADILLRSPNTLDDPFPEHVLLKGTSNPAWIQPSPSPQTPITFPPYLFLTSKILLDSLHCLKEFQQASMRTPECGVTMLPVHREPMTLSREREREPTSGRKNGFPLLPRDTMTLVPFRPRRASGTAANDKSNNASRATQGEKRLENTR
jgi:hypothetical protein